MSSEDEFVSRLREFGFNAQEAACYCYLLKHGPQTSSSLMRALHAGSDNINRTLTTLIEEDIVRPSLQTPTVYVAVELDVVLNAAMQRRADELHDMEKRGGELRTFSRQHSLHPSADRSTFKMLRSIREIASVAISTLLSTEEEFLWIAPKEGLQLASMSGINDVVRELYERGGYTRGITDITLSTIPLVQGVLDIGEEVRHFEGYRGMYYALFDRKQCMSAINIDVKRLEPDTPASILYTDDSEYASRLLSFFELLWKQAIPAQKRIDELLEQG